MAAVIDQLDRGGKDVESLLRKNESLRNEVQELTQELAQAEEKLYHCPPTLLCICMHLSLRLGTILAEPKMRLKTSFAKYASRMCPSAKKFSGFNKE